MSATIYTEPLLDAIRKALQQVMGATLSVSYDDPPQTPLDLPYVLITPEAVQQGFSERASSLGRVQQTNRFQIVIRQADPTDPAAVKTLLKAELAGSVLGALQSGPNFTDVGILPLVTEIRFTELDSTPEQTSELGLTFEVLTISDHH